MYSGALPSTSIYGTWSENVEIWSVDDDELMDLSTCTEITLSLRRMGHRGTFQLNQPDDLTLTMTGGDITLPSTGIIQWRAEVGSMQTLQGGTYQAILILTDGTDTVPIILGSISIVE